MKENDFRRKGIEKFNTVYDLVYKYLRKCADRDMKWKQRNCACNTFQRKHARKKNIHRHAPIPRVNFRKIFDDNSEQLKSDKNRSAKKRSYTADYTKVIRNEYIKCYIKEALLCGLESGLLIPIDQRNMLHISRKLGDVCFSKNAERNKYII